MNLHRRPHSPAFLDAHTSPIASRHLFTLTHAVRARKVSTPRLVAWSKQVPSTAFAARAVPKAARTPPNLCWREGERGQSESVASESSSANDLNLELFDPEGARARLQPFKSTFGLALGVPWP